jgi:hypothetical protein
MTTDPLVPTTLGGMEIELAGLPYGRPAGVHRADVAA